MTFRNHRLAYWLEYVRHLSGVASPVLVVQNRCDRPEDERLRPPLRDDLLSAFRFRKTLHYSAREDRGRGALDDALRQAVLQLRDTMGQARIGKGRLAVKRRLEALRDEDASLPAGERKYRTLTQEFFHQLCIEAGGVSDPALLLDYLHHAGIVFYQKGLFDDRIVLDQEWALQAVYAVFHREKCYRQLRLLRGRFNRTLLDALVWGEYDEEEQELFLSLMTSCGICFVHREGDREGTLEAEYIAPDLLPDRTEVAAEIEAIWDERAAGEERAVNLPFLHHGIMRGILSQVGQKAGISAVYWKYGVCLYETTTHSRALIEQRLSAIPTTWSGQIAVSTRGGQAAELLRRLREWITWEVKQSGCQGWTMEEPPKPAAPSRPKRSRRPRPAEPEPEDAGPERALKFTPPPSDAKTYCVSYAWDDASKMEVDRLCTHAETRLGISIVLDATGIGLGERISKFIQRLAKGDRVFVILSDKYLKSANCMYELMEVWRNCKMEDEEFRRRIRIFRLKNAKMMRPLDRARCAKYWKDQFEELDALVRAEGADLLGSPDFLRYKAMQDFAHRVGDVLALIADTLQPTDFDQLVQYGFDEHPPPSS